MGITSTAKLLTSVMVLPHRPPVLTAKTLATIDALSSDEYIRAFKELWTSAHSTKEVRRAGTEVRRAETIVDAVLVRY